MSHHSLMRACCGLAAGIVALVLGTAPLAWTGTPACDRGFSYFQSSAGGMEWRVFDPESRTDTLFLTVQGTPTEVVWDTAFTHVDFLVGRTLYRAPWRAGSSAKIAARFPESPEACSWWFNPDSGCWQFATMQVALNLPAREYPNASACRSELWQSSQDGQSWRLVLADTSVIDMEECGFSERLSSRIRRAPRVTLEDFAPPLSSESEGAIFDVPPDTTDNGTDWERFRVPLASVPGVGVEMFYWWSSAPEWSVSGPAWLVDSMTGTRRVLCAAPTGPQHFDEHCAIMLTEACGLLLVHDCGNPPRVVDVRTGRNSACLPEDAASVMVTPRLRP